MSRPISHLMPSVQPVTIRAQKAEIALVCRPIAEPIIPDRGPALISKLFGWGDMVNVEDAVIVLAATDTFTAKAFNQRDLSGPISRVLMLAKAMLVPMIFSALNGAKAMLTGFAAPLAPAFPLPSRLKIAGPRAVFSGAILDAVLVGFKRGFAVATSNYNRCLFHVQNIARTACESNFEAACRRIRETTGEDAGPLFGSAA